MNKSRLSDVSDGDGAMEESKAEKGVRESTGWAGAGLQVYFIF